MNNDSRYNSNVIRLSNNNLVDTQGLYQLALDLVEIPENIAWLDLSFNEIDEVTDDILEWVNAFEQFHDGRVHILNINDLPLIDL